MTQSVQRIRIDLSYDGTLFHGWAKQDGLRTVEGELCEALELITQRPPQLTVAGRTDAGVHAAHQVAHVDLPESIWEKTDPRRLTHRINGILAQRYGTYQSAHGLPHSRGIHDILVTHIQAVTHDFDARFSATGRAYRYLIADAQTRRSPLRRHDVTWLPTHTLDCALMNEAAHGLLGEHDFLAYCRPREGATTIRTLRRLHFARDVDGHISVDVQADAFCHSMVRSLVGAAIEVGRGKRPTTWMKQLLDTCDRNNAAPIAPPQGLSLIAVTYPEAEQWAQQAQTARRRRDQQNDCCE